MLFLTLSHFGISQSERKIELHSDYQLLNYDYFQIGFGFAPKNHLVRINRNNESFSFIGYRCSYSDDLSNSDWGIAFQSMVLGGNWGNFAAFGLEMNYKSLSKTNHIGIKPMIGLSFLFFNVLYGYNFDLLGKNTDGRSQHELIVGISLNVLKW